MKAAIREFKTYVVIFIFVQHVLLGKDKKRSGSVFSLMFIFNSISAGDLLCWTDRGILQDRLRSG